MPVCRDSGPVKENVTKLTQRRRSAERQGRDAEALAGAWYESRGFSILAQRLRTPEGELDLIVADRTALVFVEVKARASLRFAAEAVAPRQRRRLVAAASVVLATRPEWARAETRFDVILVVGEDVLPMHDAFRADDA